jgi:hypothetical protein
MNGVVLAAHVAAALSVRGKGAAYIAPGLLNHQQRRAIYIMLDTSLVKNCEPTRVTGWSFDSSNGIPRACMANETHSKMTSGNHKVFYADKPLPKLENVEELKAALVEAGVL